MFTAPDENIKPSRYPDKTIFESLVDPARIYCACWKHQPAPRDPRFPRFFSISGVSSFMRTSQNPAPRSLPRLQKKLTFKPAIKTEKCEIFDFSGASSTRPLCRPLGRQLVDAYNPRRQPYFSYIASQARSYFATVLKSAFSCIYISHTA